MAADKQETSAEVSFPGGLVCQQAPTFGVMPVGTGVTHAKLGLRPCFGSKMNVYSKASNVADEAPVGSTLSGPAARTDVRLWRSVSVGSWREAVGMSNADPNDRSGWGAEGLLSA